MLKARNNDLLYSKRKFTMWLSIYTKTKSPKESDNLSPRCQTHAASMRPVWIKVHLWGASDQDFQKETGAQPLGKDQRAWQECPPPSRTRWLRVSRNREAREPQPYYPALLYLWRWDVSLTTERYTRQSSGVHKAWNCQGEWMTQLLLSKVENPNLPQSESFKYWKICFVGVLRVKYILSLFFQFSFFFVFFLTYQWVGLVVGIVEFWKTEFLNQIGKEDANASLHPFVSRWISRRRERTQEVVCRHGPQGWKVGAIYRNVRWTKSYCLSHFLLKVEASSQEIPLQPWME